MGDKLSRLMLPAFLSDFGLNTIIYLYDDKGRKGVRNICNLTCEDRRSCK